jgi:hypothetical protein
LPQWVQVGNEDEDGLLLVVLANGVNAIALGFASTFLSGFVLARTDPDLHTAAACPILPHFAQTSRLLLLLLL